MERLLESHEFGPHRVEVVECPDDEGGGSYLVVIDGAAVIDPPLPEAPGFDELVRIYATWQAASAER